MNVCLPRLHCPIGYIALFFFIITLLAVDCGFLEAPKSSRVSLSGTVVNSIATYSCFPGYELVGDETRICSTNGQWAGQAPFCKGQLAVCKLTLISC